MKSNRFLSSLLALAITSLAEAKDIRFQVNAGEYDRQDCVVSLDVAAYVNDKAHEPHLYETRDRKRIPVACQLMD